MLHMKEDDVLLEIDGVEISQDSTVVAVAFSARLYHE